MLVKMYMFEKSMIIFIKYVNKVYFDHTLELYEINTLTLTQNTLTMSRIKKYTHTGKIWNVWVLTLIKKLLDLLMVSSYSCYM